MAKTIEKKEFVITFELQNGQKYYIDIFGNHIPFKDSFDVLYCRHYTKRGANIVTTRLWKQYDNMRVTQYSNSNDLVKKECSSKIYMPKIW